MPIGTGEDERHAGTHHAERPAGAGPRSADLPDLRRRQRADGRVLLAVLSTVRRLRGAAGSRRRTGRIVGSADATPFRFPTELEALRRGGGVSRVAAIVLVTVAVIGGAYWFVSRPDAVTIPESFGGLDRIEGAQTEIVAEAFRAQVEDTGIEGDLALYGDGLPTTALIWIRDASVPTTDAAFDAFANGFDAGIGDEASPRRFAQDDRDRRRRDVRVRARPRCHAGHDLHVAGGLGVLAALRFLRPGPAGGLVPSRSSRTTRSAPPRTSRASSSWSSR